MYVCGVVQQFSTNVGLTEKEICCYSWKGSQHTGVMVVTRGERGSALSSLSLFLAGGQIRIHRVDLVV